MRRTRRNGEVVRGSYEFDAKILAVLDELAKRYRITRVWVIETLLLEALAARRLTDSQPRLEMPPALEEAVLPAEPPPAPPSPRPKVVQSKLAALKGKDWRTGKEIMRQ